MSRSIQAVIIGVNAYDAGPNLQGCVNDAIAIRRQVVNVSPNASIQMLVDRDATREAIGDAVQAAAAAVSHLGADGLLLLYFAGHGTHVVDPQRPSTNTQALCPYDYRTLSGKNAITRVDMLEWFRDISEPASVWVVLDSCYSGGLANLGSRLDGDSPTLRLGAARWLPPPPATQSDENRRAKPTRIADTGRKSISVLAACEDDEIAAETEGLGGMCGIFTLHLHNRLNGGEGPKADKLHSDLVTDTSKFKQTPVLYPPGNPRIFLE